MSYQTYYGLVAWITQSGHRVALPPADARLLLGRLLRFNLTWGLLAFGAPIVPLLSILSYFVQRRSIAAQNALKVPPAVVGMAESLVAPFPVSYSENPYASPMTADGHAQAAGEADSPSFILRMAGWICAVLCPVFAIAAIAGLARWQPEQAIGGALLTAFMGKCAWDWVVRRRTRAR